MKLSVRYEHFGEVKFESASSRDYKPVVPRKNEDVLIDGVRYFVQNVEHHITVADSVYGNSSQVTIVQLA